MNKKEKGFTLVELLAVIVILAVILIIAVPQILNTIDESRNGALMSSAKLIAASAETIKVSNDTLGIEEEITCDTISELNSDIAKINNMNEGKAKEVASLKLETKKEQRNILQKQRSDICSKYQNQIMFWG